MGAGHRTQQHTLLPLLLRGTLILSLWACAHCPPLQLNGSLFNGEGMSKKVAKQRMAERAVSILLPGYDSSNLVSLGGEGGEDPGLGQVASTPTASTKFDGSGWPRLFLDRD